MSTSNRQHATTSAPGERPRVLRIGILLGGKIVEERLIRDRGPVSIGQSMKNTFSVPLDGLPLEFTLFPVEDHKYRLNVLKTMDGRLSETGGQIQLLEHVKSRGQDHGDYVSVPLSEHSRGKLTLGDLTILFQFVVEPPMQPKPMLPASVRGSIAERIDPRLSVILAISILTHFTVALIAWRIDPEVDDGIAERAYNLTFKPETYNVEVEPPPQPQSGSATEVSGGKSEASKPAKPEPPKGGGGGGGAKGDGGGSSKGDGAAAAEEAIAFANALTSDGDGGGGGDLGDMARRRPGSDLGSEISEVRESGKTVGIGGGTGRGTRGDGDPRVGTGGGPQIEGPGGTTSAGGGKGEEKGPAGRISVSDKDGDIGTDLTPDLVMRKIQSAYMAGLKRCYKEHLKTDPSARGGVALTFTVNETGRTVNGRAKGFATDVDNCISSLMSTWRFAVPKDKDDGEPTEASFSIKLQLVPD